MGKWETKLLYTLTQREGASQSDSVNAALD
jgi:hypothetical protein